MSPAASPEALAADWSGQPEPDVFRLKEARRAFRIFWRLTLASMQGFTNQRLLGWVWWLIDPLALIGVYALVFGVILGMREGPEGAAYPFFLTCALVPWRWLSLATRRGGAAFLTNAPLLSSTLVGRRLVMSSQVASASLECLMGIPVLLVFMLVYDRPFTLELLWLPVPLLVLGVLVMAVSFMMCPLMVMLPDLGNAYDVFLRVAFFLTPCVYSLERIPADLRDTYVAVNPLAGIIEGIRRPLFDASPPLWDALGWSAVWAVGLFVVGHWMFKRLGNDAIRML